MNIREKMCVWLSDAIKNPYAKTLKSKSTWPQSTAALLEYPTNSLGYAMGRLLAQKNLEPIPRLEDHDAYHVICSYSTEVIDEIKMQYFLFGNGMRSLFLVGTITLGLVLYPEKNRLFISAYKRGKMASPLSELDLRNSLHISLQQIQTYIFHSQYKFQ